MKFLNKKIMDFDLLSKHRLFLYGIATVLIAWSHLVVELPANGLNPLFTWIQKRGAVGVEIFLVLSGFGLYSSLSRNFNILNFYKKRLLRVVLPTFIACVAFGAIADMTLDAYLSCAAILPGFFKQINFWYPGFIIIMYAIYPLIFKLQKKSQLALVLLSGVISFACIGMCVLLDAGAYAERAISRVPAFLAGCILAPYVAEKRKMPLWWIFAALTVFVVTDYCRTVFSLGGYAVRAIAFFALAVLLIFASAMFAELMNRGGIRRFFYRLIAFIGTFSLEVYIVHTRIRDMLIQLHLGESYTLSQLLKVEISAIFVAFFVGFLLSQFTGKVIESFGSVKLPAETKD